MNRAVELLKEGEQRVAQRVWRSAPHHFEREWSGSVWLRECANRPLTISRTNGLTRSISLMAPAASMFMVSMYNVRNHMGLCYRVELMFSDCSTYMHDFGLTDEAANSFDVLYATHTHTHTSVHYTHVGTRSIRTRSQCNFVLLSVIA